MTRCMWSLQAKQANKQQEQEPIKVSLQEAKKNRNLQACALMLTAAKYKTAARCNYMQN